MVVAEEQANPDQAPWLKIASESRPINFRTDLKKIKEALDPTLSSAITPVDLARVLLDAKNNKAPKPGEAPAEYWKGLLKPSLSTLIDDNTPIDLLCREESIGIVISILCLFNYFIQGGSLPEAWKISVNVLLHKGGS